MADKLTDEEIVNELKRFGETIKFPIDFKKRPILIKKLNHYKAKENPPLKRSKSGGRQTRRSVAPQEFSDDSQDEANSPQAKSLPLPRASPNRKPKVLTPIERPGRRLRNRNNEEESSFVQSNRTRSDQKPQVRKNKRITQVRQMELYPNEFSDTDPDTADESLFEVEEKGINTTLDFDDTFDDTFDEDELNVSGYGTKGHKNKPNSANSLSVDSIHAMPLQNTTNDPWLYTNHVENDGKPKPKRNGTDNTFNHKEQFVSKTILTVVAVFFLFLGISYVCIRKDIFLWREPALQQDLKERFCAGTDGKECYSTADGSKALTVIRLLHKKLAGLKGQFELGRIEEDRTRLGSNEVKNILKDMSMEVQDKEKLFKLCLLLIVKNPAWDIKAFTIDGTPAVSLEEVDQLESAYGDLPLSTRLYLSLFKVLYGLFLLTCCLAVGVLGIFYLRWQNTKKEKEQRKVYDMVERIIDSLKENAEVSERKDDPKNYPAYMAVQHIRDQLIPVAHRKQMQALWDEAVQFIEANESRIRVETQMIHGEEFTVWRWLQTFPNGGRQWQGQAFGETSQTVNSLPYGPTPCLKVRNMFDSNTEQNDDDWHVDIEDAVLEKCKNNNGILHILVDRGSREGCVYMKCSSCEKAYEACQSLHGWWFDGRLITVKYLRLEHYHDRFPDSRNRKYPLRPSNNEMQSIARPYHRSALEMT